MMVFTHVLVGIVLAAIVSLQVPINPTTLVVAGLVGGGFPDIDLLLMHRKTLHFPVIYSAISLFLLIGYLLSDSVVVLALLLGVAAAALHSLMDVLGGGKEMRPWRETDDRAVYNHVTKEWVRPLRLFYDGSMPDLLLAISLGAIAVWILPGRLWPLLFGLVLLSIVYTVLRRAVTRWIPERYATFSSYVQERLRNDAR